MRFRYNEVKNSHLLKERNIGFEEIIKEIEGGNIIEIIEHHNKEKYPAQKIMLVSCLGKIYCVPYIKEKDGSVFLKTLYPSRKATKKYLNT